MRRVLVAGATGQLGHAIARDLASAGYAVAVHYRRQAAAASELVASLPHADRHAVVSADLGDPDRVHDALSALRSTWGPVDDLVNAAWPSVPSRTAESYDTAALDAALLGVRFHAHLCTAVLPDLRRARGAIVLLGGALASRIHPGLGLFGAGKAAATVLTRVIALEEGRHGVRANVISPGRVDVAAGDLAQEDPAFAALDEIGALRRVLPLPTVDEIASTVRWLIAPDASGVTGQIVAMAGGEPV